MRTLFVLGLLLTMSLQAAIPRKSVSVEDALKLSAEERITALRKIGPQSYRDLHAIAFDPSKDYELRWRAMVSMAWIGRKEAIIDLETALNHKDWFMRDAALKGLQRIDKKQAKDWARKLLTDPALVVRSSAVRTLHDLYDRDSEKLLWEKINAPENFRGEQGLFIRKQILAALVDLASEGSETKFAEFLHDKDKSLHHVAVDGLERVTGTKLDDNPRQSLHKWRAKFAKLNEKL